MTLGSSVFLVVVGAILRYALTWHIAGVDLHMLGLILMIAGIATSAICLLNLFHPAFGRAPAGRPRRQAWRQPPAGYRQDGGMNRNALPIVYRAPGSPPDTRVHEGDPYGYLPGHGCSTDLGLEIPYGSSIQGAASPANAADYGGSGCNETPYADGEYDRVGYGEDTADSTTMPAAAYPPARYEAAGGSSNGGEAM